MWQTDAQGPRTIYWMRIGLDPMIVLGPGTIGGVNDVPVDFAVAALGTRLVVAWVNDKERPTLSVSVIDDDGEQRRDGPSVTPPSLRNLSMISGPKGAGVLVGFPDGNLMRLDCAEWE